MATLRLHLGGELRRLPIMSYEKRAGAVIEVPNIDSDLVQFRSLLEMAQENGYQNFKSVFYKIPDSSLKFCESLREVKDDKTCLPLINLLSAGKAIDIYYEQSESIHPLLGVNNPKEVCARLGINEHGKRVRVSEVCLEHDEVEEINVNSVVGSCVSTMHVGEQSVMKEVGEGSRVNLGDESAVKEKGEGSRVNLGEQTVSLKDSVIAPHEGEHTPSHKGNVVGPNDVPDDDIEDAEYWVDVHWLSDDDEGKEVRENVDRIKKLAGKGSVSVEGLLDGNVYGNLEGNREGDVEGNESEGVHVNEEERRRLINELEKLEDELKEEEFDSDDLDDYTTTSDEEDGPRKKRRKLVRYDPTTQIPHFQLCMIFQNKNEVKAAVNKFAIITRRDLKLVRNDSYRYRVACKEKKCPWKLLVSIDGNTKKWMVKTYLGKHTCDWSFTNSRVTYKVLANHFISKLGRSALNKKLHEIVEDSMTDLHVQISKTQAKHAKELMSLIYSGDLKNEFRRLQDYAAELRRCNKDNTVILETEEDEGGNRFKRMYVCFHALKEGFKDGCRRIIGLDGAFLKGPLKGEILSAVCRDANNQMFPLCWAVVKWENRENWSWFIRLLMEDVRIPYGNGFGWTFTTDRQKGLCSALHDLVPRAEHRWCARHIFAKWRKTHRGEDVERQFWICAKSSTIQDLGESMEEMAKCSKVALDDFMKECPKKWCKAYFETHVKCDVVDNNLCETWNGFILEARHKSIVTLLETIRTLVVKRTVARRMFEVRFRGTVSSFGPKIWEKIEEFKETSSKFRVLHNGDDGYEAININNFSDKYIVHMEKRICTCRLFELNGLPCPHAIAVCVARKWSLENYIMFWYSKETFHNAYKFSIEPTNGEKYWPKTDLPEVLPPIIEKLPGRKKKKRILEAWESTNGINMSRRGRRMTCQICSKKGHNSLYCPKNPTKKKKKDVDVEDTPTRPTNVMVDQGPVEAASEFGYVHVQQIDGKGRRNDRGSRAKKPKNDVGSRESKTRQKVHVSKDKRKEKVFGSTSKANGKETVEIRKRMNVEPKSTDNAPKSIVTRSMSAASKPQRIITRRSLRNVV